MTGDERVLLGDARRGTTDDLLLVDDQVRSLALADDVDVHHGALAAGRLTRSLNVLGCGDLVLLAAGTGCRSMEVDVDAALVGALGAQDEVLLRGEADRADAGIGLTSADRDRGIQHDCGVGGRGGSDGHEEKREQRHRRECDLPKSERESHDVLLLVVG